MNMYKKISKKELFDLILNKIFMETILWLPDTPEHIKLSYKMGIKIAQDTYSDEKITEGYEDVL
jgi:hypothetical protein